MRAPGVVRNDAVLPLSQRAAAMMVVRLVLAGVAEVLAVVDLAPRGVLWLGLTGGYLALSGVLSAGVLIRVRTWGLRCFGTTLLLDGAYLQLQHERLGHHLAVDLLIAAHLTATCLVASFQAGLRSTLWQSLTMVLASHAERVGLVPTPLWRRGMLDVEMALAIDIGLLWLVALTAAATAAVNERELKRRRYDAEVLQRLATDLHEDQRPADVARRLSDFMCDELAATRAVVCVRTGQGLSAEGGAGLGQLPDQPEAAPSALLRVAPGAENEVLAMRLNPDLDPWLDRLLPGAHRLFAYRLAHNAGIDGRWLVFEHAVVANSRVERRLVTSASQAAATASLAFGRAELLQQAERMADFDGLTGVRNRRTFDRELAKLGALFDRTGQGFAVIMVDVDKFKSINDRLGHQVGDEVLQAVAKAVEGTCRPYDIPARYGGEEFVILVPGGDLEGGAALAERVRLALHDLRLVTPVTASFGVAAVPGTTLVPTEALVLADAALLQAKETGRDRVVRADQLGPGASTVVAAAAGRPAPPPGPPPDDTTPTAPSPEPSRPVASGPLTASQALSPDPGRAATPGPYTAGLAEALNRRARDRAGGGPAHPGPAAAGPDGGASLDRGATVSDARSRFDR